MRHWEKSIESSPSRLAKLPNRLCVHADLRIPYERMVYIRKEEYRELQYLNNILNPGDVFIDIGGNIGLWALSASTAVGPKGQVFSLEPNPLTYKKLLANIALNKVSNITAFPVAATDATGHVTFCCHDEHNLSCISDEPHTLNSVFRTVDAYSLDDLLMSRLDRVTGIKIDTEGHELRSLLGATGILTTYQPWIIAEFNTQLLSSRLISDWPVHEYLLSLGYVAYTYTAWNYSRFYPYRRATITNENAVADLELDGYQNIIYRHV